MLSIVAAVIVFVPIAWTWWGLRAAVSQYRTVLVSGPADGSSLLQLWTTGFHGQLPDFLTLPSVALGSALLIMFCMVLVMAERGLSTRAEWTQTNDTHRFAAELSAALLAAELTIRLNTANTPERGLDLVRESIDQLTTASNTMGQTSLAVTAAAQELTDQAEAAGRQLEESATSLSTSLSAAATAAAQSLDHAIRSAATVLEVSIKSSTDGLASSVGQLSDAAREHSQTAAQAATMTQRLAAAASDISSSTRNLSQQVSSGAQQLQSALAPTLTRIADEATTLQTTTHGLGEALTHHTAAAQTQITELTQIRAGLAQLTTSRSGPTPSPTTAPRNA